MAHAIKRVEAADLDELLALMRAYCDFYDVAPGLAEQLIERCRAECRIRGADRLIWQTAPDNLRAQAVYDRVGATRERWTDYWLPC